MPITRSKDGTAIAHSTIGQGPALILVDGALCYRASGPNTPLAKQLADQFTVYTYDRRGRGESSDTKPYAVEREVEDIASLIAEAGGTAHVYGISSGAALALEAANRGLNVRKLALYEAPFIVDTSRKPVPDDYLPRLESLLAAGNRAAAVKLFMRDAVGLPGLFVAMMGLMPGWSKLKGVAHTLPHDARVLGDTVNGKPLAAERWPRVQMPSLVISGTKSQHWIQSSMRALAKVLPAAEFKPLEGQTHVVKPAALAPMLKNFFNGP